MQVLSRTAVKLRVYERGAGEHWPAAQGHARQWLPVSFSGVLDHRVDVHTRGGLLTIEWTGGAQDAVMMTGPATTVFEGQIHIPEEL